MRLPRHTTGVLSFLLLVGVLLPSAAAAAPTNSAIEAKKAEADAVRRTLDDMAASLEEQVEEYNAVEDALTETRGRIRDARGDLERTAEELDSARSQLSERAAGIYKSRRTGFLDVLLGTSSFGDFLTRMDLLMRVNRQDALLVQRVEAAKAKTEAAKRSLEQRETEQLALRERLEAQGERIEAGIAQREAYLRSLDAQIGKLVAEEKARQERLAAERARKAAAAAAKRKGAPAFQGAGSLGGGHPEVVEIALRFIGVPYVWGGSSPQGFDCSGLTQYCYGQIGIDLPRTSRSQFRSGKHIPPDRLDLLAAGDLVFFGTGGDPGRVHHVGIYVGDGDFVHAPQTGERVKVSSLAERIASRGDYVGASRF